VKKTRANRWTSKRSGVKPGVVKVKIGTILEDDVVQKLKERSAKERRPQNEIIQDALNLYLSTSSRQKDLRKAALAQFCSRPFKISAKEWREIMEEDYYDQ
jgi:metal-responsive CopG/Arc/MetJ family transcriptional regulator